MMIIDIINYDKKKDEIWDKNDTILFDSNNRNHINLIINNISVLIKDDYAEFLTFEDGVLVDINAEALSGNIDCDKYKDEFEELKEIFL